MKYRIKKVTYSDGTVEWFPQKRSIFFLPWTDFKEFDYKNDKNEIVKFSIERHCRIFVDSMKINSTEYYY